VEQGQGGRSPRTGQTKGGITGTFGFGAQSHVLQEEADSTMVTETAHRSDITSAIICWRTMKCSRRSRLLDVVLRTNGPTRLLPYSSDSPIFASPFEWTLSRNPSHVWAALGPSASLFLQSTLLSGARADPVISRPWTKGRDLHKLCARVQLGTRLDNRLSAGAFTDYTARYGRTLIFRGRPDLIAGARPAGRRLSDARGPLAGVSSRE
jgi:hypothetical protein